MISTVRMTEEDIGCLREDGPRSVDFVAPKNEMLTIVRDGRNNDSRFTDYAALDE